MGINRQRACVGLKHYIGSIVFALWLHVDKTNEPIYLRNGQRDIGEKHRQGRNGYCQTKEDRGHPSAAPFVRRDASHGCGYAVAN